MQIGNSMSRKHEEIEALPSGSSKIIKFRNIFIIVKRTFLQYYVSNLASGSITSIVNYMMSHQTYNTSA